MACPSRKIWFFFFLFGLFFRSHSLHSLPVPLFWGEALQQDRFGCDILARKFLLSA